MKINLAPPAVRRALRVNELARELHRVGAEAWAKREPPYGRCSWDRLSSNQQAAWRAIAKHVIAAERNHENEN